MSAQQTWLQGAVIYQIYPRSFKDAKGSGVGNLQGIIDKLDYLGGTPDSLGVTAIWISPIYRSPMADFGYDVADYTAIDPIFGDLQDIETLIAEAHKRGIKVILDFVPNHSSDEHPWFIESKSSPDNPKRDWYIWRSPKADGSPPNNWLSVFGGSAWELDATTGQYYLHSFLTKQPDLNWDNPEVRAAMKDAMRFWLDYGVDGFRVDAVDWMSKDPDLRDDPVDAHAINKKAGFDHDSLKHRYSRDGPQLFARLNEMASVLEEYDDRFMITEAHPETHNKVAGYLNYYQGVNPCLSAPFNFEGIYLPWKVAAFRGFIDSFQDAMQTDYTPIYTIGNHDESRVASRIGPAAARTAALMLLTLPGVVFIYYGEELGMHDVPVPADKRQDPFAGRNRDPQRTPMQWDASPQAGFTTGTPWLPVADDYPAVNVVAEQQDSSSMLHLYRQLLKLRQDSKILRSGSYRSLDFGPDVFGYQRSDGTDTLLVLLNFSARRQTVVIGDGTAQLVLSTDPQRQLTASRGSFVLTANEGVILQVQHD